MLKWFKRLFETKPNMVSGEWLSDFALRATKGGWEGPRWRFPEEVKEMSNAD